MLYGQGCMMRCELNPGTILINFISQALTGSNSRDEFSRANDVFKFDHVSEA